MEKGFFDKELEDTEDEPPKTEGLSLKTGFGSEGEEETVTVGKVNGDPPKREDEDGPSVDGFRISAKYFN